MQDFRPAYVADVALVAGGAVVCRGRGLLGGDVVRYDGHVVLDVLRCWLGYSESCRFLIVRVFVLLFDYLHGGGGLAFHHNQGIH